VAYVQRLTGNYFALRKIILKNVCHFVFNHADRLLTHHEVEDFLNFFFYNYLSLNVNFEPVFIWSKFFGDAIVCNNQFLSESWAVGIHGFYLKQVTGDSGDGAILGDYKAEAAGIGPATLWNTRISDKELSFIAKWLYEYHAEKRLKGNHFFLSFAMSF
jgi:hypothetical protein